MRKFFCWAGFEPATVKIELPLSGPKLRSLEFLIQVMDLRSMSLVEAKGVLAARLRSVIGVVKLLFCVKTKVCLESAH